MDFVVGLLVVGSIRIGHAQTLQPRAAAEQRLPNVVVVMADDLGLGDIQPTNPACKIRTPAAIVG
ncbi:MAG: hypothetical protein R3B96_02160 [Pirellulaceae bacterium]